MQIVIGLILGLLVGAGVGYFVRKNLAEKEVGSAEARAKAVLEDARREAEAARDEALRRGQGRDRTACARRPKPISSGRSAEIEKKEDRLAQRESTLDSAGRTRSTARNKRSRPRRPSSQQVAQAARPTRRASPHRDSSGSPA